jgi:hypothetical protein
MRRGPVTRKNTPIQFAAIKYPHKTSIAIAAYVACEPSQHCSEGFSTRVAGPESG